MHLNAERFNPAALFAVPGFLIASGNRFGFRLKGNSVFNCDLAVARAPRRKVIEPAFLVADHSARLTVESSIVGLQVGSFRSWSAGNAISLGLVTLNPRSLTGHKFVGMPDDLSDTGVTLQLLVSDGILLVPGHQQLLLLAGHVQPVPVEHVERGACNQTFDLVPRLCSPAAEINLGLAGAVLGLTARHHPVVVVRTVPIYVPNRGIEVV